MLKNKFKFEDRFAIIATLLISIITLSFGTRESPFDYTLSMIGNRFDARLEFIVWGIITATLLIFYVLHLFKLGAFHNKKARKHLIRSGVFLVLTVLIPAIEEVWPLLHKLHAVFGALFGLSLVTSVYYFIKYIEIFNKRLFSVSFLLLMLSAGGSVFLLFVFGNNGLYEIFFFISICLVLLFLEFSVKKNRKEITSRISYYKDFIMKRKPK